MLLLVYHTGTALTSALWSWMPSLSWTPTSRRNLTLYLVLWTIPTREGWGKVTKTRRKCFQLISSLPGPFRKRLGLPTKSLDCSWRKKGCDEPQRDLLLLADGGDGGRAVSSLQGGEDSAKCFFFWLIALEESICRTLKCSATTLQNFTNMPKSIE